MSQKLQQGQTVEVKITDLNTGGEGVGRSEGRVVFVPNTVTGDILKTKIVQSKAKFARGKIAQLLTSSPHRIRPQCIVADKCGGCQWQHIESAFQRDAKRQQVIQVLQRLGGFEDLVVQPMLHTSESLNYRNKSTYPLGRSATGQVQAGYYRQGSHKIVNLNQCPVQDERLHPLLKDVKHDIQSQGWSIYNEATHQGKLRHLSLRIGTNTGEMLLTLVTTNTSLSEIETQAKVWLDRYPQLVGVCLNINRDRTNAIFGQKTYTVTGKSYLREIFAEIKLHIAADTFFQVNTKAAELLFQSIIEQLNLSGDEIAIDAYCGVGTFSLPLANKIKEVIGIEISEASIEQAEQNAILNRIDNVTFYSGKVKDYLPQLDFVPDIFLLDPPRKGCNPEVIGALLNLKPTSIVYVSCKPSTLARDIQLLCRSGIYIPTYVQPADFFPQTKHVECYVILKKVEVL